MWKYYLAVDVLTFTIYLLLLVMLPETSVYYSCISRGRHNVASCSLYFCQLEISIIGYIFLFLDVSLSVYFGGWLSLY